MKGIDTTEFDGVFNICPIMSSLSTVCLAHVLHLIFHGMSVSANPDRPTGKAIPMKMGK